MKMRKSQSKDKMVYYAYFLEFLKNRPEYKSLSNPYNSTWNMKILEHYYNISCQNTGNIDSLGMPVFKIRKIGKRKFAKASAEHSKEIVDSTVFFYCGYLKKDQPIENSKDGGKYAEKAYKRNRDKDSKRDIDDDLDDGTMDKAIQGKMRQEHYGKQLQPYGKNMQGFPNLQKAKVK